MTLIALIFTDKSVARIAITAKIAEIENQPGNVATKLSPCPRFLQFLQPIIDCGLNANCQLLIADLHANPAFLLVLTP